MIVKEGCRALGPQDHDGHVLQVCEARQSRVTQGTQPPSASSSCYHLPRSTGVKARCPSPYSWRLHQDQALMFGVCDMSCYLCPLLGPRLLMPGEAPCLAPEGSWGEVGSMQSPPGHHTGEALTLLSPPLRSQEGPISACPQGGSTCPPQGIAASDRLTVWVARKASQRLGAGVWIWGKGSLGSTQTEYDFGDSPPSEPPCPCL